MEDFINHFYSKKSKYSVYIKKSISKNRLLDEVEDLFHDAVIVGNKRIEDNLYRSYELCMYSGYTSALKKSYYSSWYASDKVLSLDFDVGSSEVVTHRYFSENDAYEFNPEENVELYDSCQNILNSMVLYTLYGNKPSRSSRNMIIFLCSGFIGHTQAELGRLFGLSRERIRQIFEESKYSISSISDYISGDSTSIESSIIPDDRYCYKKLLEDFSKHYSYCDFVTYYKSSFDSIFAYLHCFFSFCQSVEFKKYKIIENNVYSINFVKLYLGDFVKEIDNISDSIFCFLSPTPISLHWSPNDVLEINWGRESFAKFVYSSRGWYDTLSEDTCVFYKSIVDVVEDTLMDYIEENCEDDSEKLKSDLEDNFVKFFR